MGALAVNKHLRRNYEVVESITAGVKLFGFEVKALKGKIGASLNEGYIGEGDDGLVLKKCYIPPYQPNNTPPSYDPYRDRVLLVQKKDMQRLLAKKKEQGLTLVPERLYTKGNLVKLDFVLGRGMKKHDKRQALKKRAAERDLGRTLKGKYR